MIANPSLKAYRYDPYSKIFSSESYDHHLMKTNRMKEISRAMACKDKSWGVILGTLGRQGSPKVLDNITKKLKDHGKSVFTILLSEIFPQKLKLMSSSVEAWVQIACPRLSIDWGMSFDKVSKSEAALVNQIPECFMKVCILSLNQFDLICSIAVIDSI